VYLAKNEIGYFDDGIEGGPASREKGKTTAMIVISVLDSSLYPPFERNTTSKGWMPTLPRRAPHQKARGLVKTRPRRQFVHPGIDQSLSSIDLDRRQVR
jgi:hypothetical protein